MQLEISPSPPSSVQPAFFFFEGCPSRPLGGAAEALSRRGASGRACACAFGRPSSWGEHFCQGKVDRPKMNGWYLAKTYFFVFSFKYEKQTVWVLYSLTALGALWSCTKRCPSHLPGHLDFFGLGLIHLPTGILALGYIWESSLPQLFWCQKYWVLKQEPFGLQGFLGGKR